MGEVHVLPEDLVRKIAAGEVVDGPHSVVKELVENSIDAGATRIEIEAVAGGVSLLRVVDNGRGMTAEDAVLAFRRHATSKISGPDDLEAIGTLGFRGEALPSIAAVAKVTMMTRRRNGDGVRIEAFGEEARSREAGCPEGTTMVVRDLFHSVPARKKHLKSAKREFSSVLEVVTSYALSYPAIMFRLVHDGREVFLAPAATKVRERVATVFGLDVAKEMVPVEARREGTLVEGLVSKPHVTRSRHTSMMFVNRRLVHSKVLRDAVAGAYGPLVVRGRHPIVVLNLIMDPHDVDVNVHPAKTEVRFVDETRVYDIVNRAVAGALRDAVLVPVIREEDLKGPGPSSRDVHVRALIQATIDDGAIEEGPVGATERLPMELKVIGQVGELYIICEGEDGIVVIDQHAAHEKVVYERLRRELDGGGIGTQELLEPVTFDMSAREALDMRRHLGALRELGFGIEEFGERTFIVRHVPAVMGTTVVAGAVVDVLSDIVEAETGGDVDARRRAIRDRAIATMACHTAVRGGRRLEPEEMRFVVRELYSAEDPYSCPHGRPTIVSMPFSHLEKRFGRRA